MVGTFLRYMCIVISDYVNQVNSVLNNCLGGVKEVLHHEHDLFERGILQENTPNGWALLELEQILLTLGCYKDLTKGVFYMLALPGTEGSIFVRYVYTVHVYMCILCFAIDRYKSAVKLHFFYISFSFPDSLNQAASEGLCRRRGNRSCALHYK